jgi:hypothetical protein
MDRGSEVVLEVALMVLDRTVQMEVEVVQRVDEGTMCQEAEISSQERQDNEEWWAEENGFAQRVPQELRVES